MPVPRLMHDVLDFCCPGVCASCAGHSESGDPLCEPCLARLIALENAPACRRCGAPLAERGGPCPFCRGRGVRHYESIHRLGVFEPPLRDLIHGLKYHRRWIAGEYLGDRLLGQEEIVSLLEEADVLVAVPLHFLRRFTRGYNQSAVLARHLAARSGRRCARPLRRVRMTPTQTGLHSRRRREENLRGAFQLRDAACIRGRHVLVIDDVMTTGATLQAVARTLARAGPASLRALVAAVADPRGHGFQAV